MLNMGLFGSAGAGVGVFLEKGFSIGYSRESGITFGVYSTESIGAEFSASAVAGLSISIDAFATGVESGISRTMTIGGSVDVGISLGGDFVLDIDSKDVDIAVGAATSKSIGRENKTIGLKLGTGISAVAGEVHVRYNSTQTKGVSLANAMNFFGSKIKQLENNVKDYFLEKALEGYVF